MYEYVLPGTGEVRWAGRSAQCQAVRGGHAPGPRPPCSRARAPSRPRSPLLLRAREGEQPALARAHATRPVFNGSTRTAAGAETPCLTQ